MFRLLWLMAVFIIFICLSGCSSSGGDPSVSPVSSPPKNTNPNTSTDTKAIYISDADSDGVDELFVTDFNDPGVATKLSVPLVGGGQVTDFRISPFGESVLYRADQEIDDVFELYLVYLENPGVAIKVNGLLVAGGDVRSFSSLMMVDC